MFLTYINHELALIQTQWFFRSKLYSSRTVCGNLSPNACMHLWVYSFFKYLKIYLTILSDVSIIYNPFLNKIPPFPSKNIVVITVIQNSWYFLVLLFILAIDRSWVTPSFGCSSLCILIAAKVSPKPLRSFTPVLRHATRILHNLTIRGNHRVRPGCEVLWLPT